MKRMSIAAVLLLAVSATGFAQSEGIAEFKGSTKTGKGEALPARGKFLLTKSAFRMDWEVDTPPKRGKAGAGHPNVYKTTIIQRVAEPDRMYMLNTERKTYSILHMDKNRETSSPDEAYTVKKLGRDTVAGISCEKALLSSASSGADHEVCVASELVPSSAWLATMNRRGASGLGKALRDNGLEGFPIRITTRYKNGIGSTFELVRFEKTSVPSSSFEIPAGYKQVTSSPLAMTPEQEKAMKDALSKMTPEQRKQMEEMMKKQNGNQ
jgi:uncharacterized protein DUF4412